MEQYPSQQSNITLSAQYPYEQNSMQYSGANGSWSEGDYSTLMPQCPSEQNSVQYSHTNGSWPEGDYSTLMPQCPSEQKSVNGSWFEGDYSTLMPQCPSEQNSMQYSRANGTWSEGDYSTLIPQCPSEQNSMQYSGADSTWPEGDYSTLMPQYPSEQNSMQYSRANSTWPEGDYSTLMPQYPSEQNSMQYSRANGTWSEGEYSTLMPQHPCEQDSMQYSHANGIWSEGDYSTIIPQCPYEQNSIQYSSTADGTWIEKFFASVPLGYRFIPTDQELIEDYLKKKVNNEPFTLNLIPDVVFYSKDPTQLVEENKSIAENEWYFFTSRDKKYPNGLRPNRATPNGYWKATGTYKGIFQSHGSGHLVGFKRTLDFLEGKHPRGTKTVWKMLEYTLTSDDNDNYNHNSLNNERPKGDMTLDDWVLCKLYKNQRWGGDEASSSGGGTQSPIVNVE